jgi:MFS family permease
MLDLVSMILNSEVFCLMRKETWLLKFPDLAPLKEVALLRGYTGMVTTFGFGCGGPIGGTLADTIGWRWYVSFR